MSQQYRRQRPTENRRRIDRDRGRDRERSWSPRHRSRSPGRPDSHRRSPEYRRDHYDRKEDHWDIQFNSNNTTYAPPPPVNMPPNAFSNAMYSQFEYGQECGFDKAMPQAPMPPDIQWNQVVEQKPPEVVKEDLLKKEAAIQSEVRQQKVTLLKQKEEYLKKVASLQKELETLKDQRVELKSSSSKRSPSPDTKRFLKENAKLQMELQNKVKTMMNVVDMLNNIIGEEKVKSPSKTNVEFDEINEKEKRKRRSRTRSRSQEKKCNYVYYDPEMHWCRLCNEFPSTAKDYLNHLHSPSHQKNAQSLSEAPWHSNTTTNVANEGLPNYPGAPTKRTPIKGLQFFVPAISWYCKLCDQWIGDLHCASAHLKSLMHGKNYNNFVEQNPHWETDWMLERQKSFEKKSNEKSVKEEKEKEPYSNHTIKFGKDGIEKKKKSDALASHEGKTNSSSRWARSRSHSYSSDRSPRESKKKKYKHKDQGKSRAVHVSPESIKKNIKDDMISQWVTADNHTDRGEFAKLKDRVKSKAESSMKESKKSSDKKESKASKHKTDKQEHNKPVERKMPFIGKMPVYKTTLQNKPKIDEVEPKEALLQKEKEKEEEEKKKRDELNLEIKRKVLEIKEKILKSKPDGVISNEKAVSIGQPGVNFPAINSNIQNIVVQKPQNNGPMQKSNQDFQEALDIIFPKSNSSSAMMQGQNQISMQTAQGQMMGMDYTNMIPGLGDHQSNTQYMHGGHMGTMMGNNPMGHMGGAPMGTQGPIARTASQMGGPQASMMVPQNQMMCAPGILGAPPGTMMGPPMGSSGMGYGTYGPPGHFSNSDGYGYHQGQYDDNIIQKNFNNKAKPANQNQKVDDDKKKKGKSEKLLETNKDVDIDDLAMLGIDVEDVGAGKL